MIIPITIRTGNDGGGVPVVFLILIAGLLVLMGFAFIKIGVLDTLIEQEPEVGQVWVKPPRYSWRDPDFVTVQRVDSMVWIECGEEIKFTMHYSHFDFHLIHDPVTTTK